jgi:hypothetical protein
VTAQPGELLAIIERLRELYVKEGRKLALTVYRVGFELAIEEEDADEEVES